MGSADPTNVTYPLGKVTIDPTRREVMGYNKERQDFIIGPNPAPSFAGYFVARFSEPIEHFGVLNNSNGRIFPEGLHTAEGRQVSGYVRFADDVRKVEVRIGVSFISIEQARANLDTEIPDGTSLEQTALVI